MKKNVRQATMYIWGFGISQVEINLHDFDISDKFSVTIAYSERGKRKVIQRQFCKKFLVLAEGWGLPEPQTFITTVEDGMTRQESMYGSLDPRYKEDFMRDIYPKLDFIIAEVIV